MTGKKRLIPEEELQQYRAIGTIGECQEAREKQTAKRPVDRRGLQNFNLQVYAYRGDCPSCGAEGLISTTGRYCPRCGQAIEWEG